VLGALYFRSGVLVLANSASGNHSTLPNALTIRTESGSDRPNTQRNQLWCIARLHATKAPWVFGRSLPLPVLNETQFPLGGEFFNSLCGKTKNKVLKTKY